MKILEDIPKVIAEANKSQSVNKLIDYNLRLAGYLYHLNEYENLAHRAYLDAYNERKYQTALITKEGQGSATDRATNAEIEIKDFRMKESEAEILWKKLQGIKFSTSEFIGVLTQKIAYLRKENETSKTQV